MWKLKSLEISSLNQCFSNRVPGVQNLGKTLHNGIFLPPSLYFPCTEEHINGSENHSVKQRAQYYCLIQPFPDLFCFAFLTDHWLTPYGAWFWEGLHIQTVQRNLLKSTLCCKLPMFQAPFHWWNDLPDITQLVCCSLFPVPFCLPSGLLLLNTRAVRKHCSVPILRLILKIRIFRGLF